jgi:hypothetical protein
LDLVERAALFGIQKNSLRILYADRKRVPDYLSVSNISLSFIKSAYSKKASSLTKLGELLALGIPVICNSGIGDVDQILVNVDGGLLLKDFSDETLDSAAHTVLNLKPDENRRVRARSYFDLPHALKKYRITYENLLAGRGSNRLS